IHDVARPLVAPAVIDAVLAALAHDAGAAPALAVTDALWTGADDRVTGTQDRTGLFRAQTPQGFDLAAIRAAHAAHPGGAADDVEVARAHGIQVAIVPGDEDNIKITLPGDIARAERLLWGRDGH
ncbi:MAG: 2-C-methyl-D-erythritol 4-phosphate cytidylyltransferase, partial [Pseudomonadota bacterium]